MGIVPSSKSGLRTWANAHTGPWTANMLTIGLGLPQTSAFTAAAAAHGTALDAQEAAAEAAKVATATALVAEQTLRDIASECIKLIKGKAATVADPNTVFAAAVIPAPAAPSPYGPPTEATNVAAHLQNDGSILVTWKGTVSGGQFFTVWRRISTQAWAQIGSTAGKKFTDSNLPAGSTNATYMIRSHRGEMSSPGSEPVVIVFGSQSLPQAA